jgi:hypothetical protein
MNAPAIYEDRPARALVGINAESLIAKAIEHATPVETMERLLAMRATLQAERAREEFFSALAEFQARVPVIPKKQTANTGKFKYNYANLGDIQTAIGPLLGDLGLSITFDTEIDAQTMRVFAFVHHRSGHSQKSTFTVPLEGESRMSAIQSLGSALTYCRRYAMCAALGITTAEEDDDANAAGRAPTEGRRDRTQEPPAPTVPQPIQTISAAQHKRLEARIAELGIERERLKTWCRQAMAINHFTEMPADSYDKFYAKLDAFKAAQDAAEAKREAEQEAAEERAAIQEEGSGAAPEHPEGGPQDTVPTDDTPPF